MPVLLFCIAFGLSMDYEVFLVSRIREYWLESGQTPRRQRRKRRARPGPHRPGDHRCGACDVDLVRGADRGAGGVHADVRASASRSRCWWTPRWCGCCWCRRSCTCWAGGTGGRPKPLARLHARIGISEAAPAPNYRTHEHEVRQTEQLSTPVRSADRRRRAPRGFGEQLRDEILDAATELLLETGHAKAVSIRSVAQRVGVTPPSIYLHFTDKDALLDAVCARYFEKLDEEMQRAAVGQTDRRWTCCVRKVRPMCGSRCRHLSCTASRR